MFDIFNKNKLERAYNYIDELEKALRSMRTDLKGLDGFNMVISDSISEYVKENAKSPKYLIVSGDVFKGTNVVEFMGLKVVRIGWPENTIFVTSDVKFGKADEL